MTTKLFFDSSFSTERNVIQKSPIPESWTCRRSFAYGFKVPFCVLLVAEVSGENEVTMVNGKTSYLPNGSLVVFDEWCDSELSPDQIVSGILEREAKMEISNRIKLGSTCPSIYVDFGEGSVGSKMQELGVEFLKSKAPMGYRSQGWKLITSKLNAPSNKPSLVFMENCIDLITDISNVKVSKNSGEDIDTTIPSNTLEALRYAVVGI